LFAAVVRAYPKDRVAIPAARQMLDGFFMARDRTQLIQALRDLEGTPLLDDREFATQVAGLKRRLNGK
jgi:hypothetical protein